jgi:uncharacterized protein YcbX
VETTNGVKEFVENAWIGHTVAIGDAVRVAVTGPCPRCVMTTLAQATYPRTPGSCARPRSTTRSTSASMHPCCMEVRSAAVIPSGSSNAKWVPKGGQHTPAGTQARGRRTSGCPGR